MNVPFLDLPAQNRALKEELVAAFAEAVEGAAFIGGEKLERFEQEFAAFCGVAQCSGAGNGTASLVLGLKGLGVVPGDLVLTVPNTFIATTEAISWAGAKIGFVDVDLETSLMCPERLEQKLLALKKAGSPLPKVVIPVHLYGQCVDLDPVMSLSRDFGFKVLEDAAQAHGATYNGRPAGSLGHAGSFSFYPGKNLGACGEGGALVSDDADVIRIARMYRDHGQAKKYYSQVEGFNFRLDAIQAAFLSIKLRHLPEWNIRRNEISKRYDEAFSAFKGLRPVKIRANGVSSRHLYVVHVAHRDQVLEKLKLKGVQAALHYPQPLHFQECYRHLGFRQGDFPNAERNCAELLSLPLFPELSDEQVDFVISSMKEICDRA